MLDFDEHGRMLGVEILGATRLLTPETIDDLETIEERCGRRGQALPRGPQERPALT